VKHKSRFIRGTRRSVAASNGDAEEAITKQPPLSDEQMAESLRLRAKFGLRGQGIGNLTAHTLETAAAAKRTGE